MKTYLTNAQLVLNDEMVDQGAVLVEDGIIRAINPLAAVADVEVDLQGQILMPGMIDLHCDALEKEVEPRAGVYFPLDFACAQADKRNVTAGITTVYHALSFAHQEMGVRNNEFAAQIARAVFAWGPHGLVDNRLHCRYEITDATALPILQQLISEQSMHLISVMDHTPGQGQFKDIAAYRNYLTRNYQTSAEDIDSLLTRKMEAATGAMDRLHTLVAMAHQAGIAVASHDDDSPSRVAAMADLGVDISEFPITLEAAQAAKAAGMSTIFGAPNILRGKSQSASMRALDGIHAGVADCLCGDYSPSSLLAAVFCLPQISTLDLPAAIRLVTANPAQAARLNDRGRIEVGMQADLLAVHMVAGLPQVCRVWRGGQTIYQINYGA